MNMQMPNDPELDALLGAYAVDALDDDERARVEAYLSANERARAEVDEMLESAAALALAPVDDVTAPAGLWDRISEMIDDDEALPASSAGTDAPAGSPGDELGARRTARRSRRALWISLVAAAAIVVVAALVGQVVSLNHRLDRTGEQEAAAAFTRATHVAGARSVSLSPRDGAALARVVLLPDGSGYLKNEGLTQLDAGHTYQLWAVTGNASDPVVMLAGVLGSHPEAAAFRTTSAVRGFAITVERAPGVARSEQPALASATLS